MAQVRYYINASVAASLDTRRYCCGVYATRKMALEELARMPKIYPAFTRFTINTKPNI